MQELHNMFECQYNILHDHNTHRIEASKAFSNVLEWQKHIKDRPHDFPLMDKLQTKRTEVTIETWETICDGVESIIKYENMACKRRWFAAETLFGFLDMPFLDPIDQTLPQS